MINSIINQFFVVSLPHEDERKAHIHSHFQARGILNYEFIDGVYHESDEVRHYYRNGLVKAYTSCFRCGQLNCTCENNLIIPQQVGNWLAFIKVWERVAVTKGWSLICEDDVYFYENGLEKLAPLLANHLPALNDTPTLIRLGQSGLTTEVALPDVLTLSHSVEMSNAAYIINNHYAQLLLNRFEQINTTSDIWVHRDVAGLDCCEALTVTPLIATDLSFNKDFARFTSSIHPKGIDDADKIRASKHVKRAETLTDYLNLLEQWLDSDDTLLAYQQAAFKELSVKQTELIKKISPDQPQRHYAGQLDKAMQQEYDFEKTFEHWSSTDKAGNPIPWMTYSTIHYLESLNLANCNIFEWGSGNSSLYLAARAKSVISIESNPDWYAYAISHKRENLTTKLRDASQYCDVINDEDRDYDVIIIDGDIFRRLECACVASQRLAPGGIMILDNSDWLPHTAEYLRKQGFTQIDFSGPGPINTYLWCTSVFFRHTISIPHKQGVTPGALLTGIKNERDMPLPLAAETVNLAAIRRFSNEYNWVKQEILPDNTDVFSAQEGEDALLKRLLKKYYKTPGFYVDVGAHHPTRFSNTYHYYLNGWRGINIDPIPGTKALFDQQRPGDINLELGIANQTDTLTYSVFKEPAFNTFDPQSVAYAETRTQKIAEQSIQVRPLASVLDVYLPEGTDITFFSIDVEGLELAVLESNNWDKYRPKFVIAEALTKSALNCLSAYMDSVGYEKVASTKNSYFYCEKSAWLELQ